MRGLLRALSLKPCSRFKCIIPNIWYREFGSDLNVLNILRVKKSGKTILISITYYYLQLQLLKHRNQIKYKKH